MKKIIISSVVFLALIASGYLALEYLAAQKQDPPKRKPLAIRKFVQTQKVAYGEVSTDIVTFGRVRSSQPLELITEVAGRITATVPLKEGQRFNKGDILFKVDDTEARLLLQAQKSTFLRDIATILPDVKVDFPESYPRWEQYFQALDADKPLPELPSYSGKEKTFLAVKNILTSYYNIRQREESLKKHTFRAPFSGTIVEVMLQDGSFVSAGSRVAKVLETRDLELRVPVEVSDIQWVRRGTRVVVSTEDNRQRWVGMVSRIGELVNESTQSLDVYVKLTGNDQLYEGMYLRAVIPGNTIKDALEVPRSIVSEGNRVFVIEQDSILRVKEVEIKKTNANSVVIAGLTPGSELITEPLTEAYNGMIVFRLSDAPKYQSQKQQGG
ncbi:MAG: efflux RND transporter periplasmic adaptor subunit [Bernardetiaceae bacterium]